MKCANCGKEFGNGITCQNCGTDRFTGLGNYHGYSPSNNNDITTETKSEDNSNIDHTERMTICYNCNEIIPADSKYCPYCGRELTVKCPNCGNIIMSHFLFCNKCGKKRDQNYQCKVCGYRCEGGHVPDKCPICRSSSWEKTF